jgi:hypothetical protein
MIKQIPILLATILFCCSCSQEHKTAGPSALKPEAANGPVIVRLVGRETTMTVRAGARGPVYSFQTNAGEQVMPSMTLNELQAFNPDLAKRVRSIQASQAAGGLAGL